MDNELNEQNNFIMYTTDDGQVRSSEKVFWRKILDIYATSVDYDAKNDQTREFFKTVQNKMHYAVLGFIK